MNGFNVSQNEPMWGFMKTDGLNPGTHRQGRTACLSRISVLFLQFWGVTSICHYHLSTGCPHITMFHTCCLFLALNREKFFNFLNLSVCSSCSNMRVHPLGSLNPCNWWLFTNNHFFVCESTNNGFITNILTVSISSHMLVGNCGMWFWYPAKVSLKTF